MSDVYSEWMIFSRDGVYPITAALPINNAQNKTPHQHQHCFQITSSESGLYCGTMGRENIISGNNKSTWKLFCPISADCNRILRLTRPGWLPWCSCAHLISSRVRHQLSCSSRLRTSFTAKARSVCQEESSNCKKICSNIFTDCSTLQTRYSALQKQPFTQHIKDNLSALKKNSDGESKII